MKIGRLDRRIKFKKLAEISSDFSDTWGAQLSPVVPGSLDMWATKLDKPGGERSELGQDVSLTRTEFVTRYIDDTSFGYNFNRFGTYIIEYDGGQYDVKGLEEIGRREGLRFYTERRD
mgnify:CR=1 FL=1